MRSLAAQSFVTSVGLLFFSSSATVAAVCNVPSGSHATIQLAVDDLTCTDVVIAAGTYAEQVEIDRSLTISGASSTTTVIDGRLTVTGASTEVELNDLTIDGAAVGCLPSALDVGGGASVTGSNFVAVNAADGPCPIFGDGFEANDTSAWDNTVP